MLWSIFITYIITHHGLGGFSGLINGLIAAAIGALSMLMSEPTAKSYVMWTCMFVLSIATFTFTFTFTKCQWETMVLEISSIPLLVSVSLLVLTMPALDIVEISHLTYQDVSL